MKQLSRLIAIASAAVGCLASTGCADLSHREKAAAVGAAAGGVAGSVLTNGSTAGTVGGAVVGGVLGNEYGKRH
ncbi:glycine zipper 2TM domain-containing protein [Ideonella sp. BN130291]|uniref:glycine zipper 2TM domain-containing protein n=1 Tax=Ideonella sp. BN130291 TaxID=3112940 RepID=UPI002E27649A|nr:glycine zipper 2TM domain-containing protein [Ideonella sp. BN130291]